MTLEHHRCQPGQDRAGFSHAIHHLPIYHRCTIAPSSSKPPLARGHHCTGAPRRPISICYHLTGSTSTSLTSRCGGPLALAILGVPWPHLLTPRPPTTPSRCAPLTPRLRLAGPRSLFTVLPHRQTFAARRRQRRSSRCRFPPPTAISHASPLMPPPAAYRRSQRRGPDLTATTPDSRRSHLPPQRHRSFCYRHADPMWVRSSAR